MIGNYTGSVTKTFTIKKTPNTITAKSFTRTYSTKAQTFDLGVKIKNGTPTYTSNSKSVTVSKAGKVTVKAKFIGKATITITAPASKNYTATDQEDHYYSQSDKDCTGERHQSFGRKDDCEVEEECGWNRISDPVLNIQQVYES